MMTVHEFLEDNEIFTTEILTPRTFIHNVEQDKNLLNHLFDLYYGMCEMRTENVDEVHSNVSFALYKNDDYLSALFESIIKPFDPFRTGKTTVENSGQDENLTEYGKIDNASTTYGKKDTFTPNSESITSNATYDSGTLEDVLKTRTQGIDETQSSGEDTNIVSSSGSDKTTMKKGTTTITTYEDTTDYVEKLKAMYESKMLNLYDEILRLTKNDIASSMFVL